MQNYRKLIIHVDSNTGELIDEFYERIVRDNSLPKFLLADTVIAEFHFWEKLKLNGIQSLTRKFRFCKLRRGFGHRLRGYYKQSQRISFQA